MIQDFVDMDTHEKVRYISESSSASTSGYSTMSPMHRGNNMSPASSVFSMSSPAHSPATMLNTEFSNLNLPSNSTPTQFTTLHQNVYTNYGNYNSGNTMTGNVPVQHQYSANQFPAQKQFSMPKMNDAISEYPAKLLIIEQPVEKFRFRYKSEMHGTHGSLNGANSKRCPKTYPEVELQGFNGKAVIRCSLFQTNLESPHSHQLVVRRDEVDICDPHDLVVSPEKGFVAQFQNMGIIHTAKKFIFEQLLKKKQNRLKFELGREELSTKQVQELHKETEKEAKDMNLNQVRLCFEAFKVENDTTWTRIAAPVYSNPINNRKSAQTGELRIARLSIATGSVSGGDDLILLVEKVSKKNIKVRFYELNEDEEIVWEDFGRFRETDVHHQYAIVCQTPPYKDKDIDKPIEVNIELLRPSDDERSYPPVNFRYKPRDSVVSRKRRRTCSSATSSSGSGTSVNSFELPKTLQEQQHQQQQSDVPMVNAQNNTGLSHPPTISQEFNRDEIVKTVDKFIAVDSEELLAICDLDWSLIGMDNMRNGEFHSKEGRLEKDGGTQASVDLTKISSINKIILSTQTSEKGSGYNQSPLLLIFKLFDDARNQKQLSSTCYSNLSKQVANTFIEHAEKNEHGDSLIHDIIISDNFKIAFKMCHILNFFKQNDLLNRVLNANNQTGLHYACLFNRPLYIRPLLGLGCDPNIQDKHGNTALHIAVREQHTKCVESFLNMKEKSLNLTLRNDDGLTPLHLTVRHRGFDIAQKLLQYDPAAALVSNTKDGNNFLHMAVRQLRLDLIQLISNDNSINKNALLTARNTAGHTAIDMARCLTTEVGNEILHLLAPKDDNEEPGNLVIKEEAVSSGEEDDTEDISISNDEPIKEEYDYEENSMESPEFYKKDRSLKELLSDDRKFQKIAKPLNEQSKWRKLAEKIQLQKFLCLWSTAEDLLNYIKNEQSIKYETFVEALAEVDCDALSVLLTEMK